MPLPTSPTGLATADPVDPSPAITLPFPRTTLPEAAPAIGPGAGLKAPSEMTDAAVPGRTNPGSLQTNSRSGVDGATPRELNSYESAPGNNGSNKDKEGASSSSGNQNAGTIPSPQGQQFLAVNTNHAAPPHASTISPPIPQPTDLTLSSASPKPVLPAEIGTPLAESAHSALLGAPDTQATPAVNSAQLIQSIHHSEMRLGMQSAEFGSIAINTTINRHVLSAQISLDHVELGQALSLHLPAIEQKLGTAYGVQARVELQTASDSSQGHPEQQAREGRPVPVRNSTPPATPSLAVIAASGAALSASTTRLDIRI